MNQNDIIGLILSFPMGMNICVDKVNSVRPFCIRSAIYM